MQEFKCYRHVSLLIMALTLELLRKSARLMPFPGVIPVFVNLSHYRNPFLQGLQDLRTFISAISSISAGQNNIVFKNKPQNAFYSEIIRIFAPKRY